VRLVEALVLFVAGPSLLAASHRPGLLFPAIWTLGAVCLVILLREPRFVRGYLWNWTGAKAYWRSIWPRFLLAAALLTFILYLREPSRLLALPRHKPGLWALILLLYPVLSVYPQEVAFRAMFLHRYEGLFPARVALLTASASAFAFAHIVMRNWWAIGLCFVGGLLFAGTYTRSRSLAAVCIEHTLYGWFLFTVGWGVEFYSGSFSS
jgi:uncharacterized protein